MSESDEELNELLDDATKDFKVFKLTELGPDPLNINVKVTENVNNASQDSLVQDKLFEEVFKGLTSGNPTALNEDFLSSFLNNSELNGDLQPDDISDQLKSAFNSMKDNMQSFRNISQDDGDIMKMMADLGVGEEVIGGLASSDPTEDSFFAVMQSMMRNLLSKDILYPSLKDVATQYPEWLTNNAATTLPSDLQRYNSQFAIIEKIVIEFDAETSLDPEPVKTARFHRILDLMQAMQPLGQPPPELLTNLPKNVEFDNNGLPKFSPQIFQNSNEANSYVNNCTLM